MKRQTGNDNETHRRWTLEPGRPMRPQGLTTAKTVAKVGEGQRFLGELEPNTRSEPVRVHPGRAWRDVLKGRLQPVIGDREIRIDAGRRR